MTDAASTGGVSWVDYDGDGDLDLYVTNGYDVSARDAVPQPNRLYRNEGDGAFTPVVEGPLVEVEGFSSGSTWGDYDNDGDLDVFVSNQQDQNNFLFQNQGDGTFARVTDGPLVNDGGHSYAASWVDVDGDGHLDLFVANGGLSHAGPNFLYRNQRDGSFSKLTTGPVVTDSMASGAGIWGDYDGDNDPDLFVASRGGPNALYRNDGGWTFTAVADSPVLENVMPSMAAAWGDYDDDGDLDLVVGALYGAANRLFRNDGTGHFTLVTDAGDLAIDGGHTYGVNWGDYDDDGDLDLAVANWGAASVLYENDGAGHLERVPRKAFSADISHASSLAWGDYDGDGDLDLVVGNWPNEPGPNEWNHLYRNERGAGNWLQIRLQGTVSNRSAIGARVAVRAEVDGRPRIQYRMVSAHTSWRSQNGLDLHVGLGDADVVNEMEVTWPSGQVQRLTEVAVNQRIEIIEAGKPHSR